mgnify:CR=1 FL=1
MEAAGIRLFATGEATDDSFLQATGDVALGLVTSHHYSYAHPSARNRQFTRNFEAEVGAGLRPNYFAVTAYDGMSALSAALPGVAIIPAHPVAGTARLRGELVQRLSRSFVDGGQRTDQQHRRGEALLGQADRGREHLVEREPSEALVERAPAVDTAGHGDRADVVAERHLGEAFGAQGFLHPRTRRDRLTLSRLAFGWVTIRERPTRCGAVRLGPQQNPAGCGRQTLEGELP